MSDYKDLFSNKSPKSGGSGSFFQFEPGSFGSYWWRATQVLFWVGTVLGLLHYGHQGLEGILGVVFFSAIIAPMKGVFWGGIFWVFSRLFR
jgi:hypothetical protein